MAKVTEEPPEGWAATQAERIRLGQPRFLPGEPHITPRDGDIPPRGGGIPAFRPTDEQRHLVQVMAANHVARLVIAKLLKISPMTLDKYFRKDLEAGWEETVARVGFAVVKEALNGNVGAQKYWLSTHGGPEWRVPKDQEQEDRAERREEPAVRFYIPSNNRDQPEGGLEPPTIDADPDESGDLSGDKAVDAA